MGQKVAVISAGSWGMALSCLLAANSHDVRLHCYPAEIAEGINTNRHNPLFFPDKILPDNIQATVDLEQALADGPAVYLVVPTRYLREFIMSHMDTWQKWAGSGSPLCNCTKGLLLGPTERTDAWLADLFPETPLVHLAGPNFAKEVIAGLPAAAVVAGPPAAAELIQEQLISKIYRVYTGSDTTGVEVAGFYKNIIAIASGAVHELGLGHNARAALITRALSEMSRLVEYFGGDRMTLVGLAGIGDLYLTCSSELSRNFQVGMRRAQGQSLEQILGEMREVAEGIQASKAVHLWPEEHGLSGWPDLPIAAEVYRFVHEGAEPMEAITRLMRRPPKAEHA